MAEAIPSQPKIGPASAVDIEYPRLCPRLRRRSGCAERRRVPVEAWSGNS
jgi:hypothetical protein